MQVVLGVSAPSYKERIYTQHLLNARWLASLPPSIALEGNLNAGGASVTISYVSRRRSASVWHSWHQGVTVLEPADV